MIILADNDIIHKLACFDLLTELLAFLDCAPKDVHVLPTLKFWLRKKLRGQPEILMRCDDFLSSISEAPAADAPQIEAFIELDVGEQQLFALMAGPADPHRLITGDKRALALVGRLAANDADLLAKLKGRVECLEGILLGLIEHFGFEAINTKISAHADVDGVCRMAFGPDRTREHAETALRSWLNDVRGSASFVNNR